MQNEQGAGPGGDERLESIRGGGVNNDNDGLTEGQALEAQQVLYWPNLSDAFRETNSVL